MPSDIRLMRSELVNNSISIVKQDEPHRVPTSRAYKIARSRIFDEEFYKLSDELFGRDCDYEDAAGYGIAVPK